LLLLLLLLALLLILLLLSSSFCFAPLPLDNVLSILGPIPNPRQDGLDVIDVNVERLCGWFLSQTMFK
jgi:hypothetical protein